MEKSKWFMAKIIATTNSRVRLIPNASKTKRTRNKKRKKNLIQSITPTFSNKETLHIHPKIIKSSQLE